MMNKYKVTDQM